MVVDPDPGGTEVFWKFTLLNPRPPKKTLQEKLQPSKENI
jgi:hypothetical protein